VIVLDPGHGGIDPGAISRGGSAEKDVVLDFARRLRAELAEDARFTVHLTREEDVFIPLAERIAFARDREASLFVSIHADSIRYRDVSGATVYTLSEEASDSLAAAIAEQENRSDELAGLDVPVESDAV